MNENVSSVIRLLHQGIPGQAGQAPIAEAFSLEALNTSVLAPGQASESSAPWHPCAGHDLHWLERPLTGLPSPVYITGAATSSLDVAKELLQRDLFPEWTFVLSLSQSSGRGQMRRAWVSPEGNLYMALRLPNVGPFATFAAAPAIGGLVAEALSAEDCPVMLKWPNDLLQSRTQKKFSAVPSREECHKVGGILLEERHGALIAGIGLNITSFPPILTLRDNYAFSAGTLCTGKNVPYPLTSCEKNKENEPIVTIFTLAKRLVERIFSCYAYTSDPALWWPALAEKHLAFRGCRITLADACPENDTMVRIPCEGIVDGVTPSGALRLRTEYGMDTFLGGSLLPGS
ncbi:MAG: biotin--acetyl-CoA-carboxylase ligase [Mailhella sp.]|nr:biotin--acetyl-CoA-carboxylase ligase [Mailhella sp.]